MIWVPGRLTKFKWETLCWNLRALDQHITIITRRRRRSLLVPKRRPALTLRDFTDRISKMSFLLAVWYSPENGPIRNSERIQKRGEKIVILMIFMYLFVKLKCVENTSHIMMFQKGGTAINEDVFRLLMIVQNRQKCRASTAGGCLHSSFRK